MTKRIQRTCGHKESVWFEDAAQLEWSKQQQCSKCWQDTKVLLYGTD
ncbi:MAG: hypothetical protein AB7R89_16045 [Dehalococcoidia bacterium]